MLRPRPPLGKSVDPALMWTSSGGQEPPSVVSLRLDPFRTSRARRRVTNCGHLCNHPRKTNCGLDKKCMTTQACNDNVRVTTVPDADVLEREKVAYYNPHTSPFLPYYWGCLFQLRGLPVTYGPKTLNDTDSYQPRDPPSEIPDWIGLSKLGTKINPVI